MNCSVHVRSVQRELNQHRVTGILIKEKRRVNDRKANFIKINKTLTRFIVSGLRTGYDASPPFAA